jgi:hypothetical protein
MRRAPKKTEMDLRWLKAWFDLAPDERKLAVGILAIALVGLLARYVYLKHQTPEPIEPDIVASTGRAGGL